MTEMNGFENLKILDLPKEPFENIEVDLSKVTPEQWVMMKIAHATEILEPASASILLNATPENIDELLVKAFNNNVVLSGLNKLLQERSLDELAAQAQELETGYESTSQTSPAETKEST
jgi:hypothetical protein